MGKLSCVGTKFTPLWVVALELHLPPWSEVSDPLLHSRSPALSHLLRTPSSGTWVSNEILLDVSRSCLGTCSRAGPKGNFLLAPPLLRPVLWPPGWSPWFPALTLFFPPAPTPLAVTEFSTSC